MAEITQETAYGVLNVHGWRKDTMQAAADLGVELMATAQPRAEFVEFEGCRSYLKGGPLREKTALRFALARRVLRRKVPRIREYNNLSWLIERHFQAVLPFAAGVFVEGGLPRFQYLLTQAVEDGVRLDDHLLQCHATDRMPVLRELAREMARMHSLGFLHHDLYPRNLLVRPEGRDRRIVFLDAWAGGPPTQLRRPAYDLGALFLEGADLFKVEEQREFFAIYFEQRQAQGRPAKVERTLAAVARQRERLRQQLVRDPSRRRGRALPSASWSGPAPNMD
ncbi:MAG: tRNA A-37 threonylcarbamoyl transferase component Bud32 [Planctomycetota bacterium]|jgi:tRNA A-37 threonylcarbamoyl transferase component Bud32